MKNELKPCPWCGIRPEVGQSRISGYWSVVGEHAYDCALYDAAFTGYRTYEIAVRSWNDRYEDEE